MSVGGIDGNDIYTCILEGLNPLYDVRSNAYCSTYAKSSELVFTGIGFVFSLQDILVGN